MTAVEHIQKENIPKSIVFVDSESALMAACHMQPTKNKLVQLVHRNIMQFLRPGQSIVLCRVPSHVGIAGNEKADKLNLPVKCIHKTVMADGMESRSWKQATPNKIHAAGIWEFSSNKSRPFEVLLCRLRIGRTCVMHGYLLNKEHVPVCHYCGGFLSALHMLS